MPYIIERRDYTGHLEIVDTFRDESRAEAERVFKLWPNSGGYTYTLRCVSERQARPKPKTTCQGAYYHDPSM